VRLDLSLTVSVPRPGNNKLRNRTQLATPPKRLEERREATVYNSQPNGKHTKNGHYAVGKKIMTAVREKVN
jgi:hypothetical protein